MQLNSENTEQNAAWVSSLLQVSDPLFPTGAYAHSMGLEQWVATCGYKSGEELVEFFADHAGPSLARLELPYLRYVREALVSENWATVLELDNEIDAWKWASEIREASISQGRGRLRLLKKLWKASPQIEAYSAAFASGEVRGHHLVISALQFELLKVPYEAGLMTYGYQSLANFVSASIKLLRISPESAQLALAAGIEQLPEWVAASKEVEREDAGWFAPAFDIASARHATAFSRLFIS
ncbi:MAG: urease accessory protein UreF [Opitutaceae bacterium]